MSFINKKKFNVFYLTTVVVFMLTFFISTAFTQELKKDNTLKQILPRQVIAGQYKWISNKVKTVSDITKLRQSIKNQMINFVDYTEFSKKTLRHQWKTLSKDQQKIFMESYKKLIERTYAKKFEPSKSFTMEFKGKTKYNKSKTRAKISTIIHYGESEVEVNYLLHKTAENWMVYDLIIDDVSLVKNYRPTFGKILKENGFKTLIEKIDKKADKK